MYVTKHYNVFKRNLLLISKPCAGNRYECINLNLRTDYNTNSFRLRVVTCIWVINCKLLLSSALIIWLYEVDIKCKFGRACRTFSCDIFRSGRLSGPNIFMWIKFDLTCLNTEHFCTRERKKFFMTKMNYITAS